MVMQRKYSLKNEQWLRDNIDKCTTDDMLEYLKKDIPDINRKRLLDKLHDMGLVVSQKSSGVLTAEMKDYIKSIENKDLTRKDYEKLINEKFNTNIKSTTIYNHITRNKIKHTKKNKHTKKSPIIDNSKITTKIIQFAKNGFNCREIGDALHINTTTINSCIKTLIEKGLITKEDYTYNNYRKCDWFCRSVPTNKITSYSSKFNVVKVNNLRYYEQMGASVVLRNKDLDYGSIKNAHKVIIDNYSSIPKGWQVVHLDGNPLNDRISNLLCVKRSVWFKCARQFGANKDKNYRKLLLLNTLLQEVSRFNKEEQKIFETMVYTNPFILKTYVLNCYNKCKNFKELQDLIYKKHGFIISKPKLVQFMKTLRKSGEIPKDFKFEKSAPPKNYVSEEKLRKIKQEINSGSYEITKLAKLYRVSTSTLYRYFPEIRRCK